MKQWFANLKIGLKLGLAFGLVLGLLVLITFVSFGAQRSSNETKLRLTEKSVPCLIALLEVPESVRTIQRDLRDGLLITDTSKWTKSYASADDKLSKEIEDFASHSTEADSEKVEQLKKANLAWKPIRDEVRERAVAKDLAAAKTVLYGPEYKSTRTAVEDAAGKALQVYREGFEREAKAAEQSNSSQPIAILLVTLSLGIGIGFCVAITRSITKPISEVSEKLAGMKDHCMNDLRDGLQAFQLGDLTLNVTPVTTPVHDPSNDEIGRVAKSFNEALAMVQESIGSYNEARTSLCSIVRTLSDSSQSVAATSQELATNAEQSSSSANEIAAGSEKLAQNASELASIVEELGSKVFAVQESSQEQQHHVAKAVEKLESARKGIADAEDAATQMTLAAKEGNEAVKLTVASMENVKREVLSSAEKVRHLDEKGKQIGQIVQSIEGIAGQTNLLALNAAIEAARAGEHGRGFAVVAEEVRKLAEEASRATQQISGLIESVTTMVAETVTAINVTTREVEAGAENSTAAGQALTRILASSQQVTQLSQSVAQATEGAVTAMSQVSESASGNLASTAEMAQGANLVSQSIANVAAASEESAAGAQELTAIISQVEATSGGLNMMSTDLRGIVDKFRVDQTNKPNLKIAA